MTRKQFIIVLCLGLFSLMGLHKFNKEKEITNLKIVKKGFGEGAYGS